jgi:ABC-type phosphate transport system substrate-binding protein
MGPENAFVGTDQPPSAKFEEEILKKAPGATVLSIPVLQAAVALPVHLPKGCLATSGKKKKLIKRLVLSDAQLQGIFARTIKTWAELTAVSKTSNPFEDTLVNDGAETCESSAAITRVVRKEGSGTTAIFKKFLYEINKANVRGSENWNELAEGIENTPWPEETEDLVKAEKGSGIAKGVAEHAGSIGYANLNEVRENLAFVSGENAKKEPGTGGEGTPTFWAPLENKKKKYEEPGTNSDIATPALANCEAEVYISINGVGKTAKFPPASTRVPWNEVTASTEQKASYPLCGFTYDLALTKYSAEAAHTSAAEVETVKAYLQFILGEGQKIINENHDFLELPEGKKQGFVLKKAQEGAAEIAF